MDKFKQSNIHLYVHWLGVTAVNGGLFAVDKMDITRRIAVGSGH
jgi:hypothetical protein